MRKFVIKKVLLALLTLWIASILVFLITSTGDQTRRVAEGGSMGCYGCAPVSLENIRLQYGFQRPLYIQYLRYLTGYPPADPKLGENSQLITKGLLRGDLGWAYTRSRPVLDLVREYLPNTLILVGFAILISLLIGVLFGVSSALRKRTRVDSAIAAGSFFFLYLPIFFFALMLILIFTLWLKWLPVPTAGQNGLKWLILPALTLAASQSAVVVRLAKSSLLRSLEQKRIKGRKSQKRKAIVHTFVRALAVMTPKRILFLLSWVIIIELVFSWPGIGRLMVFSAGGGGASSADLFISQGTLLVFVVLTVVANLIGDLARAYLSQRYGGGT